MSPKSKKKSGNERRQDRPEDMASYKLFMLNLHRAMVYSVKLEEIFHDLPRIYEGDYIYGKSFVAETAINVTETLDTVSFYLNALTGGRDIDLFYMLDNLKSQINKCFAKSDNEEAAAYTGNDAPKIEDTIQPLLGEIMDCTIRVSISSDPLTSTTLGDTETAHDLLIYCYNRIFDILDYWLQSVIIVSGEISPQAVPIIGIPISYLQQEEKPILETGLSAKEIPDHLYSNPGASKLREGIYEVFNSNLYAPFLEQSYKDANPCGMIFYSNEALALYHIANRFKSVVIANICDAVGGNYINLLIGSAAPRSLPLSSHQLVRKLLDWLDFHSFNGYGFTIASIKNMTRDDMENHLNMLGKLLAFVSSTGIPPVDDESVQQNIEVFLENII